MLPPADDRVRPTADRIKETMFNILMSRGGVYGEALDLFAGTGGLGIEALSRGAEHVVFVDKDPDSARLTRENLRRVGIGKEAEVYNTDYRVALKKLRGRRFDFVFLDPPYADRQECEIVSLLVEYGLLSLGATVVVERDRANLLCALPDSFTVDDRICGNTALTYLKYTEEL